jgi:signal-transduction protein with cAMP-binding, CBS, and nucleotidyltransferase domain
MDVLLSAKGADVTVWRATQDFAAHYRQALLDLAASDRNGSSEAVFSERDASLDANIATHRNIVKRLDSLTETVANETSLASLKEQFSQFYGELYRHFELFRSAPAFYQMSTLFLRQASAALMLQTRDQLGLYARHLPEMTLVAVGTAGRCEYSPFSPLQMLLIHDKAPAAQQQTINLFCHALHENFEAAGIILDASISPRNPRWRGSRPDWNERCATWLQPQEVAALPDLFRLADQYQLHAENREVEGIIEFDLSVLQDSRTAIGYLIGHVSSLSNGLGIMGGLKLEWSGGLRGLFRLHDYGLKPLAAALSALALLKKSSAVSYDSRILDLLKRGEIDVDLAERMLKTWYHLNDLRLQRERAFPLGDQSQLTACLNPEELTADQRHTLKDTLEAVSIIQRRVENIFSGIGE